MVIRPTVNQLPKLVDTYENVFGNTNPWGVPGAEHYGIQIELFHSFMLVFHANLPVMNDLPKLEVQISRVFHANDYKYSELYKLVEYVDDMAVAAQVSEFDYTDEMERTGHDDLNKSGTESKKRTGNVSNSGTDSGTNKSDVTDKVTTYESATFKDTAKSHVEGYNSLTHGKRTSYNDVTDTTSFTARKDETAYNSTFTRTVSGRKTASVEIMEKYMEFVRNNNLFMEIINDVIAAISCIVYIPYVPEIEEE